MASEQFDIHRDLVEKSKTGSSNAQYKIYKLYSQAMFSTCMRIMNSREEAEDMLQEAFTEAFMKLESFRWESTFGAWLKRITINKCINEIKRRKADLEYCEDIGRFGERYEGDIDLPKINVEMIRWAMEQLPNGSKMIFQLYLLEGYDHREISTILNVSESNSKSQYMRAKRRIKELLKDKVYEN